MKALKLAPFLILLLSATFILNRNFYFPDYARFDLLMYSNPQRQAQALSGSSMFDYIFTTSESINSTKNCPNILTPYHQNTIYDFEHFFIILSYYIKDSDVTGKPFKIMRKEKIGQLFYHPLKSEDLVLSKDCNKWVTEAIWLEEGTITSLNVIQHDTSLQLIYIVNNKLGDIILKDVSLIFTESQTQATPRIHERKLSPEIDSVTLFNNSYFWTKKLQTNIFKENNWNGDYQLSNIEFSNNMIDDLGLDYKNIDLFKTWFFQGVKSPHGDLLLRLYEIKKMSENYLTLTILNKKDAISQIKIPWTSSEDIVSCTVSSSDSGILILVNNQHYFLVSKNELTQNYEFFVPPSKSQLKVKIFDYDKIQVIDFEGKKLPVLAHIPSKTNFLNVYLVEIGLNNLWENVCVLQKVTRPQDLQTGFFLVECTGEIFGFSQLSKETTFSKMNGKFELLELLFYLLLAGFFGYGCFFLWDLTTTANIGNQENFGAYLNLPNQQTLNPIIIYQPHC